jgi:hypothetical protein
MNKITCVLCNDEIPAGWPAICLPKGFAHRFRTECAGINPATQAAIEYLQQTPDNWLGYTFTCADAVQKAGERMLDSEEVK